MFDFFRKTYRKRFGANSLYYRIIDDMFGILPNNIELYKLALIHRSASVFLEDGTAVNNERLEFLGDAVIETIVSDFVFIEFPYTDEGFMTRMRSRLVSRNTLNDLCQKIGLSDHLVLNTHGGLVQKHAYGNALEAMIGAIYLDKGFDCANRVMIDKILEPHINIGELSITETDFKSRLIEWCQKSKHSIQFVTNFSEESTAQRPHFRSLAMIDDLQIGYGMGPSKKEAEQHAAFSIWRFLDDAAGDNFLDLLDTIEQRRSGA